MSLFDKFIHTKSRKNKDRSRFCYNDDFLLHDLTGMNEIKKLSQQMLFVRMSKINVNARDEDFGGRTSLHIGCHLGNYKPLPQSRRNLSFRIHDENLY